MRPRAITRRLLCVSVLASAAAAALAAPSASAAGAVIVRAKGAQMDEAVEALKAELGGRPGEIVVDEATAAAAVAARVADADVVVAVGQRAAKLALTQQGAAPVVHCMVLQDAEGFDGERSVGVSLAVPAPERLRALKRVAPKATRVGVLYDPKLNARAVADLEAAARAQGLTLVAQRVAAAAEAPAAVDALLPKVDALVVIPDATVITKPLVTFLVARAFEKRLPALAFSDALVKVGLLAALAPSYAQNGKLCGKLAKRVQAGEAPKALHGAVEMSGVLVVNSATARRIGAQIAPDVLKPPTIVVGE